MEYSIHKCLNKLYLTEIQWPRTEKPNTGFTCFAATKGFPTRLEGQGDTRGIQLVAVIINSKHWTFKSANHHLHYSFQMCESERKAWIQPVVISFPIHVLKQFNLKTVDGLRQPL